MNLQNLRWPVVVVTLVVALGVLFAGGFLVKSRTVNDPLAALYTASPAVEDFTIQESKDGFHITLKLSETVDLAQAYGELAEDTARLLAGTDYDLQVTDGRTPALEETERRVNLYVQEALATGQFAAMADRVEEEALQAGQTARVAVDSQRVYVELREEDGYLYSVTERSNTLSNYLQQIAEGGTGR